MQLEKLDAFGAARRANWAFYRDALAPLEDVLVMREPAEGSDPSWFGFMVTVRDDAPFSRGELVAHLESKKVQTRMLFGGNLIRQPALTDLAARRPGAFRVAGDLAETDRVMSRGFWVGVYPGLTSATRAYVAEQFHVFVKSEVT